MTKESTISGIVLLVTSGCLMFFANTMQTLVCICIMLVLVLIGYIFGFCKAGKYSQNFRNQSALINKGGDDLFDLSFEDQSLNELLSNYKKKVATSKEKDEEIVPDVDTVLSKSSIEKIGLKNMIEKVPTILVMIGIICSFVCMMTAISDFGQMEGWEITLSLEEALIIVYTAFFSIVVGIVLSLIFSIMYKFTWNAMMTDYDEYIKAYHMFVIPSESEQMSQCQRKFYGESLKKIDELNKNYENSQKKSDVMKKEQAIIPLPIDEEELLLEIMRGMKNNEFTVFMQPKCDFINDKIVGAEALVRWDSPTHGLIAPASFISVLEKSGQIVDLDMTVWEIIFKMMDLWIASGRTVVPVSLNLSKLDVLNPDTISRIAKLKTDYYDVPTDMIKIEIDAETYTSVPAFAKKTERELMKMGYEVIVDNVKCRNLRKIITLKPEAKTIKLDIIKERLDLDGIRELMENSDYEFTVEGVETADQVRELSDAHVFNGQGYFYFKPMNLKEYQYIIQSIPTPLEELASEDRDW